MRTNHHPTLDYVVPWLACRHQPVQVCETTHVTNSGVSMQNDLIALLIILVVTALVCICINDWWRRTPTRHRRVSWHLGALIGALVLFVTTLLVYGLFELLQRDLSAALLFATFGLLFIAGGSSMCAVPPDRTTDTPDRCGGCGVLAAMVVLVWGCMMIAVGVQVFLEPWEVPPTAPTTVLSTSPRYHDAVSDVPT